MKTGQLVELTISHVRNPNLNFTENERRGWCYKCKGKIIDPPVEAKPGYVWVEITENPDNWGFTDPKRVYCQIRDLKVIGGNDDKANASET